MRFSIVLKKRRDGLGAVFHQGRVLRIGQAGCTCGTFQPYGGVSVGHKFREHLKHQRVDARGVPRGVEGVVVHARWRIQRHALFVVAVNRAQAVRVVEHVHVEPVRRHALHGSLVGFNRHGVRHLGVGRHGQCGEEEGEEKSHGRGVRTSNLRQDNLTFSGIVGAGTF